MEKDLGEGAGPGTSSGDGFPDGDNVNLADLEKSSESPHVVRALDMVFTKAVECGASHVHIEPSADSWKARFRIDGILSEELGFSPMPGMKGSILARLKSMAGIDIAERRLPQEGIIKIRLSQEKELSFKICVMPTVFGEKAVLELLDPSIYRQSLNGLGLENFQLSEIKKALHSPGLVLVTGDDPAIFLYSILREKNGPGVSICTAESAVRDLIPGVSQVQMHEEIGLYYAAALRVFSRQNPDIAMVNRLNEFEAAENALDLSSQCLVLAGMQRDNTTGTICTLLNMGVEPWKIISHLKVVWAQRTLRKICEKCRKPFTVGDRRLKDLDIDPEITGRTFFKGAGCPDCHGTGFQGSMFIHEVLVLDEIIKNHILGQDLLDEITEEDAVEQGMVTLRQSGIKAALAGLTTLSEVVRATEAD